ncbi:MAG: family 43 glycosylhydrolase [Prevotella sp.]|nr:family 43 glycosylhydrolase [Prevotella sp.]
MLPIKRIRHQLTICRFLFGAILLSASLQASGASYAKGYKNVTNSNPISVSVFCADPTALVYKGRLYIYGTNDHQEFIANGKKGKNSYNKIKSLVVFSTDDMVNWTFHGTIDVKKVCSWCGNSWAPSAVWRTNAETGEDEFFIYFANGGSNVGVLKSTVSPVGPFISPNSQAMVRHGMPGVDPCTALFDPGAVIDENGTGWITVGGYSPNAQGSKLQPNNVSIIKLKPSMTEIDGTAVKIPAPYHFEANELNVIGGKYVFTYCSHWDRDPTEWNTYKSEHNINANMPDLGTMCYMVSDTPMDPDSWEFKGYYGPGVQGNNHSHLQKFQDNYYHIYHNHGSVLLDAMKSGGDVDVSADDYRSICINEAIVDESTATIKPVTLSLSGVKSIKNLNPYQLQQAETMATSGGIMYENFKNITKVTSINTLGNDASENLYINISKGDWTMVRDVDFGEDGAKAFILRAKGAGKLEIRLNKINADAAATIAFTSDDFTEHHIAVDQTLFNGVQKVFFVFTDSYKVQFDAWRFSQDEADNIKYMKAVPQKKKSSGIYDLSGHRIQQQQGRGVYIQNGKKYVK